MWPLCILMYEDLYPLFKHEGAAKKAGSYKVCLCLLLWKVNTVWYGC